MIGSRVRKTRNTTPTGLATEASGATTIELLVCKAFTGVITRVQVGATDSVEEAIPVIADQIEYTTPDWERIGLYNLTRDFEYQLHERFADTATQPGDLVIMADGGSCHKEEHEHDHDHDH